MMPIIQRRQAPQRKQTKLAEDDGTPRRQVNLEVMDVPEVKTERRAHNRGNRHRMTHHHYRAVKCLLS